MKALCWHGKGDIRYNSVDDPALEDDRDVIIKVTSCAICGSDLHLMNGYMPTMESGDVLGHETMGEVVEVGEGPAKFKVGDPGGRPVQHGLRRMLLLPKGALLAL